MCDTNVLEKLDHAEDSPWAAPTFAQPKKTGDICGNQFPGSK